MEKQIIILVIASRGEAYDVFITGYWVPLIHYIREHGLPIHVRLLFGKESDVSGLTLAEDMYLKFNTEESYVPGILQKTLAALKWTVTNYNFKHVVRTNLSSVFDIRKLLRISSSLPNQKVYAGVPGVTDQKKMFVSGAGIWLSKDLCHTLVDNADRLNTKIIDDVAIGMFFLEVPNVRMQGLPRIDVIHQVPTRNDGIQNLIAKNPYHIRIKTADRNKDAALSKCLSMHMLKPSAELPKKCLSDQSTP